MGEIKIHTWRKLGMRVFSILILPGCIVSRKQLGDLRRANAHFTESNCFQLPLPVVRVRNMRLISVLDPVVMDLTTLAFSEPGRHAKRLQLRWCRLQLDKNNGKVPQPPLDKEY